jgi:hypothetical protein
MVGIHRLGIKRLAGFSLCRDMWFLYLVIVCVNVWCVDMCPSTHMVRMVCGYVVHSMGRNVELLISWLMRCCWQVAVGGDSGGGRGDGGGTAASKSIETFKIH